MMSASTSAAMADYDVFLNHHGPDVKSGFIAHLDDALRRIGLNPFLDKKSLVKGSLAFTSIDNALEVAKIHVAVVSKGYAESTYCLNELVAMMRSGKPVIPIFYDVEPTHLRWVEKGPFAIAFQKHKSRETLEVVGEWEDALRKLADVTGFCFCLSDYNGDEAELKWKVVDAIMSLISTNEALEVDRFIVGCMEPMKRCIQELEKMQGITNLLALVGMGGIGKTTLAKVIYNHLIGHKKFHFSSFIEIDSSSPLNLEIGSNLVNRLRKQLLEDLLYIPNKITISAQSYKYWFCKLSCLGPILIVLDNISETHQFEELIINPRVLAPGSCIIVTSRDRHLLKVVARETHFYLHEVTTLGCDDSQKLFNWHAFHQEEVLKNFEALSNAVIKTCGGLPLALKVVGSSLFGMTRDEDQQCIWPQAVNALKGEPNVMNALKWSYNCLSESERLMFVDIACVFCGWKKHKAMEIWNSCKNYSSWCGLATSYISLRHLIDKSLVVLEKFGNVLAMHGILRDFGRDIGRINGSHLWEGGITNAIMARDEGTSKVRALNLANSLKHKFGGENFAKMKNLHFLILDGCDVRGDLRSSSQELRWLRWRDMPSTQVSVKLNLSNLVSLDFSHSTQLANLWTKSNPWLEACKNLLRLNLKACTSIKELPDSIKHLSQLRVLVLDHCNNLQRLPTCIGQLSSLDTLYLKGCRSLKALPYTITKLPLLEMLYLEGCTNLEALPNTIDSLRRLRILNIPGCSSISKLPATLGHMTSLKILSIDLMIGQQAIDTEQLNGLEFLRISNCTDEGITLLDSLSTLQNLKHLWMLSVWDSMSMTKLPETITLLTNLRHLELYDCEKFHVFPSSFGQLKMLNTLALRNCNNLKILPDCLEIWGNLKVLIIEQCKCISKLPNFIKEMNELEVLYVNDCGNLEDLNALSTLQSLRIWGCTSIKELQGSHLIVVDIHFIAYDEYLNIDNYVLKDFEYRLKESHVLEENDCGSLHIHHDTWSGDSLLLRVYKSPCEKRKRIRLDN